MYLKMLLLCFKPLLYHHCPICFFEEVSLLVVYIEQSQSSERPSFYSVIVCLAYGAFT